jgi:hypothetical protein
MPTKYEKFVERKRAEHGDKFSTAALDKKFLPFFESGERIKVDFGHDTVKTGTVGVTGGWRPTFLLMLRSDSVGSIWTLGKGDTILGVQTGGSGRGKRFYPPNGNGRG